MRLAASTCPSIRGKRVRYSTGLVLGLDEFLQEQTYFLEKNRAHARGLHGYGVMCGLDVGSRGDPDPEIVVAPGIAINPRGQTMMVDQDYCLRVNAWLERRQDEVEAFRGSPPPAVLSPDDLTLYPGALAIVNAKLMWSRSRAVRASRSTRSPPQQGWPTTSCWNCGSRLLIKPKRM